MAKHNEVRIIAPDPAPAADPGDEIAGALHRTLNRHADWAVNAYRNSLEHIGRKQAGYVPAGERDELAVLRENLRAAVDSLERIDKERPAGLDDRHASEVAWHDLTAEARRDGAAGVALWAGVKQTAADERAIGATAAEAVEPYHGSPWQRARFIAVRAALADGLHPRNGMERLLLDGMAQAWTMHEHWLGKHAKTESLDAWHVEKDARERGEWQPPRMRDVEAIDRAAMLADRFHREFLRMLKAYRDQRRLFGAIVVAGGQLNIAADGGQQVVATRTIRASPRNRPAPRPRARSARRPQRREGNAA